MKKILLTLVVVILCFLTACNGIGTMEVREPNKYEGGGTIHSVSKINLRPWFSVKELADNSDVILETEFLSDLGTFDVDDRIYTFYEMKVVKTIKGEVQKGETIKVRIQGGVYNDVLYYNDFTERFTKDFGYILFLDNPQSDDMVYGLSSIAQGYLPFQDDALSLNTNMGFSLFHQGQSKRSVIRNIKSSMTLLGTAVNSIGIPLISSVVLISLSLTILKKKLKFSKIGYYLTVFVSSLIISVVYFMRWMARLMILDYIFSTIFISLLCVIVFWILKRVAGCVERSRKKEA